MTDKENEVQNEEAEKALAALEANPVPEDDNKVFITVNGAGGKKAVFIVEFDEEEKLNVKAIFNADGMRIDDKSNYAYVCTIIIHVLKSGELG